MISSLRSKIFSSFPEPRLALLRVFALLLPFPPTGSPGRRMPSVFFGRSLTWPEDDLTEESRPKYLLMVFALAGDSRITSERAIDLSHFNPGFCVRTAGGGLFVLF